jgi:hypothetical protein
MTRGILIAGNEASLTVMIAREAARRVDAVATALIPNRLDGNAGPGVLNVGEGSSQIPLGWNPGSPISARSLILGAGNRLGRIDNAILVCSPPAIRKRPADLSPADIEVLINDHIKGWLSLVRELALYFRNSATPKDPAGTRSTGVSGAGEGGVLAMVIPDISPGGKEDAADIAGPVAAAAFRGLAQSMLIASTGEPYRALGFSSAEAGGDEEFAAYIFKVIDEGNRRDSGRWFKFGRLNLFR